MSSVIFDIETGPLPLDHLQAILPAFDPATLGKPPGDFDEASVKLGNLKDAAKIQAKIDDAREKHAADAAAFAKKLETGESDHWSAILDRAALSAVTGQVVAIGYGGQKRLYHYAIDGMSEAAVLKQFWAVYKSMRATSRKLVGFRIKQFDVPFIVQRSYILGVDVPGTILTPTGYLDSSFVDLNDIWSAGNRFGGSPGAGLGTLNTICKACGLVAKSEESTGAEFAQLIWSESEEDREKARRYLEADISATEALAERLGVR